MSTKQIRISKSNQIRTRIGEFQGKKINIVLHDGNAFVGTLKAISDAEITLVNMREKAVKIMFTKINEIYFDTKV